MNRLVRNQILAMYAEDQDMRASDCFDSSVDERNIKKLKSIINKYGWPTYDSVGPTTAKWAWLLVQHADFDVKFQIKCLTLMKNAVKRNQARKEDLAYLTDRVLINTGKKQLYGTQFYIDEKGKFGPRPINNQKNLDARRKKMGLPPFNQYKQHMIALQSKQPSQLSR